MASVIATQIQQKTTNQLETVVQALATKFGFDAAEALLFLNSTESRKRTPKKAKKARLTPEQKVARELARAALAKARKLDREKKAAEKKAAKQAEREEKSAAKKAAAAAKKAAKKAEREAAKETKVVAKLRAQLVKLFENEELNGARKERADECKNSAQLKELIIVVKAELRAKKMRATQLRKHAEKLNKLRAEVQELSTRGPTGAAVAGGKAGDMWVKFEPGQIESADMDELREIRKTLKKCIRKLDRADAKACREAQRKLENALFDAASR